MVVEGIQYANKETHQKRKMMIIRYRWKNMFEILKGGGSKGYKKKNMIQNYKNNR